MKQPFRWRVAAVPLAVTLLTTLPHPASAQPAESAALLRIAMPQQSLTQALAELARRTRTTLVVSPSLLEGKTTPALSGDFTPQQALDQLLTGSGLSGTVDDKAMRVQPAVSTAAQPGVESLPTVTITAERENEKDQPFRTAGSSSVLTRDDIERSRGTSVGDIFKGTTGVLIGENRNSGGLDVNIRGMQGQGRVPVLVDGARQETTVYRGYAGVASRSYIDPDLIGGIQIDKGPTLSAQGTGATGGLVSMRTLNAEDIVRPGETFGLRLRGQAIGNNSGSAVPAGTPAGLFTGNFSGAEPVYRTNCINAAICASPYAIPEQWGYTEGMNRPDTFQPRSGAGSLAVAKRLESIDLVAAVAQRQQGNYYAGSTSNLPADQPLVIWNNFWSGDGQLRTGFPAGFGATVFDPDLDNPLYYILTATKYPAGSSFTKSASGQVNSGAQLTITDPAGSFNFRSFLLNLPGEYEFQLLASDGVAYSDTKTVNFSVVTRENYPGILLQSVASNGDGVLGYSQAMWPVNITSGGMRFTGNYYGTPVNINVFPYQLYAADRDYTITDLVASSTDSSVQPYFEGLQNNQVIRKGETVTFNVMRPAIPNENALLNGLNDIYRAHGSDSDEYRNEEARLTRMYEAYQFTWSFRIPEKANRTFRIGPGN